MPPKRSPQAFPPLPPPLAVTFVLLGGLQPIAADIIIDGYTNATNDRFTNDGTFIMSGFDLSGVGQASTGRWATAISRNVIISANHLSPSGTISFFPGNDASATPVTRTI